MDTIEDFNPYEFLGVGENITLEAFKQHCIPLLKKSHPDRGGDVNNFKKIKTSIKIITDNIKSNKKHYIPKTHLDLKSGSRSNDTYEHQKPSSFFGIDKDINPNSRNDFNIDKFNDQFQKLSSNNDFLLSDKDSHVDDPRLNRTRDQFFSELKKQTEELTSNTKKLFEDGKFDTTVFNYIYNETNKSTDVKEYKEPENCLLTSTSFTSITSNFKPIVTNNSHSGSDFMSINSGTHYDKYIDEQTIQKIKSVASNITDTSIITDEDRALMKSKLSEYKPLQSIKKPTSDISSTLIPPPVVIMKGNGNNASSDDFQRKLNERNQLLNNNNNMNNMNTNTTNTNNNPNNPNNATNMYTTNTLNNLTQSTIPINNNASFKMKLPQINSVHKMNLLSIEKPTLKLKFGSNKN
jgi:hypothetical protein